MSFGENNNQNLDFSQEKLSYEEIIINALESNIPLFFHCKQIEDSYDKLKKLGFDFEIVYLDNQTSESLNGKNVYDSSINQMIDIPPTWYTNLVSKSLEKENEVNILLFRGISTAPSNIQVGASNIISERLVNGKFKLPENVSIVVVETNLEKLLSNSKLSTEFLDMFMHIDVHTTLSDWLKSDKGNNLHPAIYGFLAHRLYLASNFVTYDGVPDINYDKWEMASKLLYKTGKPNILSPLIGKELTDQLIWFCKCPIISIEDIINNNYSNKEFKIIDFTTFNTVANLSYVGEENLQVARNFVAQFSIPELTDMFDKLWTRGDEKRSEILNRLNDNSKTK